MHSFSLAKAEMMKKAGKWNVKYDETKKSSKCSNISSILKEKVKEKCYGIPLYLFPKVMPEFRGRANERKFYQISQQIRDYALGMQSLIRTAI